MASIADLFFTFRGDDSQLQVDATKAGDKAGASFGTSFGANLKRAAGGAIGAGIGVGLGMMLTGANQLDAATRQLQADTGMTAAEAAKAEHALAGMYQNNLQGFDAIGAAMSKVHTDLHLTGAEADAMTAKFLKFSTATGQDASGAVASFREILDAWNLSADQAGGLMNKLIVSHQKFGGVIADNEVALKTMAPAMQAANMTVDDGIALLNLFAAAGIDASRAPMALAHAVKLLQPGQGLNDLIAQISSIQDPTLRAQEAMKIFGARGGTQLAQAFKPGITSLDAYKISANDAAGATDTAAAAVQSGFGAQFTLLLHKAGGALAEFGQSFGPLLMVASAFGPQLTRAIAGGLGGLAGLMIPRVTAAVTATGIPGALAGTRVGAMIGAAMGAAIPVSMAVGLGALIGGAIGMAIEGPVVDAAKKDMAAKVGDALSKAVTIDDLQKMRATIQAGMDRMNSGEGTLFGWDIFGGKDALQAQLDAVDAKIADTTAKIGADAGTGLATGATAAKPKVEIAIKDLVKTFGTSMAGVVAASKQTGADGMLEMAKGINAARHAPLDAFDTLKTMLKNAMSKSAETARLNGELHSRELARGMKSADPEVRAQAIAVRDLILARLAELKGPSVAAGAAVGTGLAGGMTSKVTQKQVTDAIAHVIGWIEGLLGSFHPQVTIGVTSNARARATGGPASANQPYIVGEYRPELFIPETNGRILPSVPTAAGAVGGQTVNVTVNNPKPEAASTSTKRELQKLAAFGVLA